MVDVEKNSDEIDNLVSLYTNSCYDSLMKDKKYKNPHYIQRRNYLKAYRHDKGYIDRIVELTKQEKEILYKSSVEIILFIRSIIKEEIIKELNNLENKNMSIEDDKDFTERMLIEINKKVNEKYENDIFFGGD